VAIFLGVDGGGTKTTCVVGNEDSLLATATAGGSNVVRLGEEQARKSLHEAIHRACEAARIELSAVQRISVGMAGAGRPQIGDVVRRMVAEIFPGNVLIAGDMVIALEAAFGEGPGIVAISDEGSAHWIGRSAVVAVMKAHDEGSGSSLFKVISQAWDVTTLGDLVRAANATPAPNFAELFAPILAAAEAGDLSARTVLTQAGAELAGLAKTVISRIFEETPDVRVAMSGGVFRNSALVRQVFYNSLRSEYPSAAVASTMVEPVKGALEIARRGHVRG